MSKKNTSTPHDLYFKKALKNPQAAKNFLQYYLPPETLALIQLETIESQNVEFIDEDLKKTASDVLFRVKTIHHKTAYIYVLLEHQRKPEKLMPFRLLKYLVRILDAHLVTHKTSVLPLVIPLVLYNGEKSYPYSMDIIDLFSADIRQRAREQWVKPFSLLDLSQLDSREVKDDAWVSLLLNALKHGPTEASPEEIINVLKIDMVLLAEQHELGYIQDVFQYLCEVKERRLRSALWRKFQECLQPVLGEEFMISIADEIRQEAREQGMQQGMQEGVQQGMQEGVQQGMQIGVSQIAKNLLAHGFDLEVVAENTGLSIEVLKKLHEEVAH